MHLKSQYIICKAWKFFCIKNISKFCTEPAAKPLRSVKSAPKDSRPYHFVDYREVTVAGGRGGNGEIAFMRLYKNPLAGPSGGNGGNGGHVIFQACNTIKSLERVPSAMKGRDGERGRGKHMHGANGEHYVLKVPIGTVVKENNVLIYDLSEDESKFVAARGGAGGHGNHFFLTNKNRHPGIAEMGAEGDIRKYELELKIMAHVGLVGFPNCGKSTLLRAISRAHPKVASYPFTTLNPHIGIVHYDDYVQLAVADLPGLIPGAHENRGLGISFLKHIERCSCILYVVDLASENCWEQLQCLKFELEQYQEGLSNRPHAIVANKCDSFNSDKNIQSLKANTDIPIFPISAKFGQNIRVLLDYIRKLYDNQNKKMIW